MEVHVSRRAWPRRCRAQPADVGLPDAALDGWLLDLARNWSQTRTESWSRMAAGGEAGAERSDMATGGGRPDNCWASCAAQASHGNLHGEAGEAAQSLAVARKLEPGLGHMRHRDPSSARRAMFGILHHGAHLEACPPAMAQRFVAGSAAQHPARKF